MAEADAGAAEPDASWLPGLDGSSRDGARVDAGEADGGASVEDGGMCDCVATGECVTARCAEGSCVEEALFDGTACGEMGLDVCVDGTCVARGCGDGFREPASSAMREGCDDGNTSDGDSCSSSCSPTPLALWHDPAGLENAFVTEQAPIIGVDGTGAVLVVWAEHFGTIGRLRGQRLTRGGVPIGAAFEIDADHPSANSAEVTTVGLAGGGWVVVWTAYRSDLGDIPYRVVASDGTVSAERLANSTVDGAQNEARVAPVGDGFVIVWSDTTSRLDDRSGGIRARLFSASGAPTSGEMFVATERSQREARAQVASDGTRWTVVWHRQELTVPATTTVLLRRFDGATPRDSSPMQAVPDGGRGMVIAALADGNWALAWMTDDGQVYARVVDDAAPALVPTDVFAFAADPMLLEARPVIAAYGSGFTGAWDQRYPRVIAFGTDPTKTLPAEAMLLAMALEAGDPPASLMSSPDGVWFAWSGDGFGTSARGLAVFHLPVD